MIINREEKCLINSKQITPFKKHPFNPLLNPFQATGIFFLYILITSENQMLPGGIQKDQWHEMG